MCIRLVVCFFGGGRKTFPPTTPQSHIQQVTNTCEAIPGSFPRRTRRVGGQKGLRDRQLRSVPGNTRCPEARTFKTPRLLETDAGGSARGLVGETSARVPQDALVYLGEGGLVCSGGTQLAGGVGARFTRAPVHFPGGLGRASGSHPRSSQIHLG